MEKMLLIKKGVIYLFGHLTILPGSTNQISFCCSDRLKRLSQGPFTWLTYSGISHAPPALISWQRPVLFTP